MCHRRQQKFYFKDDTKTKSSFKTLPINKWWDAKPSNRYKRVAGEDEATVRKPIQPRLWWYIYVFENSDIVKSDWTTYNFKKALSDNGKRKIRFLDLCYSAEAQSNFDGGHPEMAWAFKYPNHQRNLCPLRWKSGSWNLESYLRRTWRKKPGTEMKWAMKVPQTEAIFCQC